MDEWFTVIEKLANRYTHIEFLIPIHPNPNVMKHRRIFKQVKVVDPLNHDALISYVKTCLFVISDSGGLQEECSYLNKKIVVCRKTTERPESVGIHSFICDEPNKLPELVDNLMTDYKVDAECPYGDGFSWRRIKELMENQCKNQ
jgi:UDP-N-acetylglucosamine 2-epimerase (non-hydrolysing)